LSFLTTHLMCCALRRLFPPRVCVISRRLSGVCILARVVSPTGQMV
jgi:hypothetical protein